MNEKTAILKVDGLDDITLPVHRPTLGHDVVDVTKLGSHGIYTFDPGYGSTASCESKITFIDGEKGQLLHGGYSIEDLASKAEYLEVCYLLLHGELPNQAQAQAFEVDIKAHRAVDDKVKAVFNGFAKGAHPMAMLMAATAALAAIYHDEIDINDADNRLLVAKRLVAKLPTLSAMCYKHSLGEAFVEPRDDLDHAENFLNMMFGQAGANKPVSKTLARAMNRIFVLHADHEQNASTSTARLSGSAGTNPFAAITASIATLWGPAHGGANEAVLKMLDEIGDASHIDEFIERAKDKSDPFKLMGFGHRVYKNYDPRATVMRESCNEVLDELGINNPKLDLAMKLEKIALSDEYFKSKKLFPNVDFYSGIVLSALGIPTSMFTVIFALSRTVGWIAHWNEMLSESYRIGRPRQLYTGHAARDFVELADRK